MSVGRVSRDREFDPAPQPLPIKASANRLNILGRFLDSPRGPFSGPAFCVILTEMIAPPPPREAVNHL